MALFGFGKEKKEGGSSELVMAYLEDALRVRTHFLLRDKRRADVAATLQSLDEEAGTATFQAPGGSFEKGSRAEFLFILENLRLGGTLRIADTRSNVVVAEIPDELELMERRKLPRARVNSKEGASVTALTNLFEGVGVNGILENISEGGCRVRVEKAINVKDERRLPLGTALLPKGQAFMLLKLNRVPRCPGVMELNGKVAYLEDASGGLSLGIEFEKPRSDFASAIRNLVSGRSGGVPTTIPPKSRRRAAGEEEALVADKAERPPRPVRMEAAPAPGTPPEPDGTDSGAEPASPSGEPLPLPRNPALLRLKKRSRAVVVLASPDQGQLLCDFLMEDGYGRVFVAASPEELSACARQPNIGLVLIDTDMPLLDCFEMVSQLFEGGEAGPPVMVAAQEVSRALVLAAHRAGVSQLLVKPYQLDETFAGLLERQMGL